LVGPNDQTGDALAPLTHWNGVARPVGKVTEND